MADKKKTAAPAETEAAKDPEKSKKGAAKKAPKEKKQKKPKKEKKPRVKRDKKANKEEVPGQKKGKTVKKLILILVLVLVLAAAALFFVFMLRGRSTRETGAGASSSENASQSQSSELDPDLPESASDGTASADGESSSGGSMQGESSSGAASVEFGETMVGDGSSASSASSGGEEGGDVSLEGQTPDAPVPSPAPSKPPELVIDRSTLEMPEFSLRGSSALERAVNRDIHQYLVDRDARAGAQTEAVVLIGSYPLDNGMTRAITYIWGLRFAIAQNTMVDYDSVVGPIFLDYSSDGQMQKMTFARAGDAYKDSVKELCGPLTEAADSINRKSFDIELHALMVNSVKNYIAENHLPVDYFTAGGDTYLKDGTPYYPPGTLPTPTPEPDASSGVDPDKLKEDYEYMQGLPE